MQEGSPAGTNVGQPIPATDAEGNSLTFSIGAGNDAGGFAIDQATGQITVANSAVLNFEDPQTHRLTVVVTDDGAGKLSASAKVTVVLTNRNEPPVVTAATFTVAENSLVGAEVGTVLATDPDAGDTLRYTILSSLPSAAFSIDADTGLLTVSRSDLNYEQDPKCVGVLCCSVAVGKGHRIQC